MTGTDECVLLLRHVFAFVLDTITLNTISGGSTCWSKRFPTFFVNCFPFLVSSGDSCGWVGLISCDFPLVLGWESVF